MKSDEDEQVIECLLRELNGIKILTQNHMNTTEFEKDDPTNWHIC